MAGVKFEKGSKEWDMFMDFWKLCQKYWEPEETEEYWYSLVDDINSFYQKHNTSFAKKLYWSLHQELEQKLKEKRKHEYV